MSAFKLLFALFLVIFLVGAMIYLWPVIQLAWRAIKRTRQKSVELLNEEDPETSNYVPNYEESLNLAPEPKPQHQEEPRAEKPPEPKVEQFSEVLLDASVTRHLYRHIVGLRQSEPVLVERRPYTDVMIEYATFRSMIDEKVFMVLQIKDQLKGYFEYTKGELGIPLCRDSVTAMRKALLAEEETFVRLAPSAENRLKMEERIRQDRWSKSKNTLLRWYQFQPLRMLGKIDQTIMRIPWEDDRLMHYNQTVDAYFGRDAKDILFMLRFDLRLTIDGLHGGWRYLLYYPFGPLGRFHLRNALKTM
ncbi:MAG TPA: hypothetical protein PKW95_16840 [bacterium]|nr:hypothetical protein [bacterium]